jgi:hypothetical protein
LLLLLALTASAWHLRQRRPLFALGIFLFFSGHLVTSNIIGLELAFEHRNHFPLIGIVIAVGDLLAFALRRVEPPNATRVLVCFLLIGLAGTTVIRARTWSSGLGLAETSVQLAPQSARAWNTLCVTHLELGGGPKPENPNLLAAIAACEKGAEFSEDSITSLTNVIVFKSLLHSATPSDWERYLGELRLVSMKRDNANSIWILINNSRNNVALDETRLMEAIDIATRRKNFSALEYAALGYFIAGHTSQPENAHPYFARAVERSTDPLFAERVISDLRAEGHERLANQLNVEAQRQEND